MSDESARANAVTTEAQNPNAGTSRTGSHGNRARAPNQTTRQRQLAEQLAMTTARIGQQTPEVGHQHLTIVVEPAQPRFHNGCAPDAVLELARQYRKSVNDYR